MKRGLNELNYDKCSNCGHPAIEIQGQAFHVELEDIKGTEDDILFVSLQCDYNLIDADAKQYVEEKVEELEDDIRDRVTSGYRIQFYVSDFRCICKDPKVDHKKAENRFL